MCYIQSQRESLKKYIKKIIEKKMTFTFKRKTFECVPEFLNGVWFFFVAVLKLRLKIGRASVVTPAKDQTSGILCIFTFI